MFRVPLACLASPVLELPGYRPFPCYISSEGALPLSQRCQHQSWRPAATVGLLEAEDQISLQVHAYISRRRSPARRCLHM